MMPHVIVVGAGAAGLTAAYTLQRAGCNVQVLEASHQIGGRIRKDNLSCSRAVDLGAQWIHRNPKVLEEIVGRPVHRPILRDKGNDSYTWNGKKLIQDSFQTVDWIWKDNTWFDFFHEEVAAHLEDGTIVLGCVVARIDYSADQPKVFSNNGQTYTANHVIVTSSIQVLQDDLIDFVPLLPSKYLKAIHSYNMQPAFKVFLEFKEKFYPKNLGLEEDYTLYEYDDYTACNHGQRDFADASWQQTTDKNVLELFAYGQIAQDLYVGRPKDQVIQDVLTLLDDIFDGKASNNFINGVVMDWSQEPYIRTGYTCNLKRWAVKTLKKPIHNKIFFAGEAIPTPWTEWGCADMAALSGKRAANQIINNYPKPSGEMDAAESQKGWWRGRKQQLH